MNPLQFKSILLLIFIGLLLSCSQGTQVRIDTYTTYPIEVRKFDGKGGEKGFIVKEVSGGTEIMVLKNGAQILIKFISGHRGTVTPDWAELDIATYKVYVTPTQIELTGMDFKISHSVSPGQKLTINPLQPATQTPK